MFNLGLFLDSGFLSPPTSMVRDYDAQLGFRLSFGKRGVSSSVITIRFHIDVSI